MSNSGNIIGGHKAAINNPNVSEEAKEHSRHVLSEEFGTEVNSPQGSGHSEEGKNPNNVAGGLKAALNNPNVSDEAKQSAEKRLADFK